MPYLEMQPNRGKMSMAARDEGTIEIQLIR